MTVNIEWNRVFTRLNEGFQAIKQDKWLLAGLVLKTSAAAIDAGLFAFLFGAALSNSFFVAATVGFGVFFKLAYPANQPIFDVEEVRNNLSQ